MTDYHLKPPLAPSPLPAWQEAKAKRRQVLEAIRKRRAERYKQFLHNQHNRRLHASDGMV